MAVSPADWQPHRLGGSIEVGTHATQPLRKAPPLSYDTCRHGGRSLTPAIRLYFVRWPPLSEGEVEDSQPMGALGGPHPKLSVVD